MWQASDSSLTKELHAYTLYLSLTQSRTYTSLSLSFCMTDFENVYVYVCDCVGERERDGVRELQ